MFCHLAHTSDIFRIHFVQITLDGDHNHVEWNIKKWYGTHESYLFARGVFNFKNAIIYGGSDEKNNGEHDFDGNSIDKVANWNHKEDCENVTKGSLSGVEEILLVFVLKLPIF